LAIVMAARRLFDRGSSVRYSTKRKIIGVLVGADALFNDHREQVVSRTARHAMAGVYPWREYVTAGGLVSYGPNQQDPRRLLKSPASPPDSFSRFGRKLRRSPKSTWSSILPIPARTNMTPPAAGLPMEKIISRPKARIDRN
jgi:hypothetical protein